MKKEIITILTIISVIINSGWIYPTTFRVKEVNTSTDTVYMVSGNGNVFSITGTEDWCEGDLASAIMFSNGTEEVADDIIMSIRYSANL